MKIAIFSDNFYPELSGISDSIISFGRELARQGHEVRFYAAHYTRRNYQKVALKPVEINLGPNIKVIRLPSVPIPSATGQGRFALPIGMAKRSLRKWRPNIIHTNHFGGVGLEAIIAARGLGVPLIGTNHTPFREFMKYSPVHTTWTTDKVLGYISWYYNQCDFVSAPSRFLFEEMIHYGFKKPHAAISNPIHPEEFHPAEPSERYALREKFDFKGPVTFYAGRLAPEKHVDVLIRAFAETKKISEDAELVVIGSGVSATNLKKLSRDLGVEKRVKFLGFLDKETLIEIYQAADIFAVASTAEMQCLSMMNAMLAGLPVIGVKAGALPEYINNQNGFVVDPDDVHGLADKITYLVKNPDKAAEIGRRGRNYAQQFSSLNITQKWLGIYKTAILDFNGHSTNNVV